MKSLLGSIFNKSAVPFTAQPGPLYGSTMFGRNGQRTQMTAMGASATLYSIVSRTGTAVAKETWHLHRETKGGICDDCEMDGVVLVSQHPALVVLNRPNNFYTRQELFESGQQHVDLTGEGWTIISRYGKVPGELWVARPDRMVVVTDPRDFLTGYIYCAPSGLEIPIVKEDVLSIRMPNPLDPYRGMGPVQTILSQVEGTAYSAEWNANFYRNGARPGGIVQLTRRMNDTEFIKLVRRFNQNHGGIENAGRTAFLEADASWVDVKPMTMADMQLVETSNLNRDTILLAFGASKFDVGVLEDVNRASATAAKDSFGERMTVPRLDRWKGMLDNDFLPQFPGVNLPGQPKLSFAYSSPVGKDQEQERADKLVAAQVFEILTGSGVEPAAAAEVAGLPEMVMAPKPEPQVPPSRALPSPDGEPVAA